MIGDYCEEMKVSQEMQTLLECERFASSESAHHCNQHPHNFLQKLKKIKVKCVANVSPDTLGLCHVPSSTLVATKESVFERMQLIPNSTLTHRSSPQHLLFLQFLAWL